MPKSIIDWFDINNPEHIAAYQLVVDKGYWPPEFLPSKKVVIFPAGWPGLLAGTIAEQLLAQRVASDGVLQKVELALEVALSSNVGNEFVKFRSSSLRELLGDIRRVRDPKREPR